MRICSLCCYIRCTQLYSLNVVNMTIFDTFSESLHVAICGMHSHSCCTYYMAYAIILSIIPPVHIRYIHYIMCDSLYSLCEAIFVMCSYIRHVRYIADIHGDLANAAIFNIFSTWVYMGGMRSYVCFILCPLLYLLYFLCVAIFFVWSPAAAALRDNMKQGAGLSCTILAIRGYPRTIREICLPWGSVSTMLVSWLRHGICLLSHAFPGPRWYTQSCSPKCDTLSTAIFTLLAICGYIRSVRLCSRFSLYMDIFAMPILSHCAAIFFIFGRCG